jgi:N-glycosylase/DNA lyase
MKLMETLSEPESLEQRLSAIPTLFGRPISLNATLNCGQAFRWKKDKEEWIGVIGDSVIKLGENPSSLEIDFTTYPRQAYNEKFLTHYFGLGLDLSPVLRSVNRDEVISRAIDFGLGLRILNQDPWECLASFICATNTSIRNVLSMIQHLSQKFGKRIECPDGILYTFPSSRKIANAGINELISCKLGFRGKFLKKTASVISRGEFAIDGMKSKTYEEAHEAMISQIFGKKQLLGIGPKVADCVLLFSLEQTEAFPIDVWMKKIIRRKYQKLLADPRLQAFLYSTENQVSIGVYRALSRIFRNYFGKYAGYAQEYLYHFARNNDSLFL